MKEQDLIHTLVARFFDGETTLEEERRLYAFFQRDDVPEDLQEYQEMFRAYAAIAPEETKRAVKRPLWWRMASVAAGLLLVSLMGYTLYYYSTSKPQEEVLVKNRPTQVVEKPVKVKQPTAQPREEVLAKPAAETPVKENVKEGLRQQEEPTLVAEVKPQAQTEEAREGVHRVSSSPLMDGGLIYASNEARKDTLPYQAPGRMDEFIVKMANYHQVKGELLDCTQNQPDTTVASMAYVFDDKEEQNLFGRLLQAACWYDSKTPGYLLNFSHQQFFFCLKDLRLGLKYLWIAERVNGKILLYSTHSPIDTEVSSECYQRYRDKLTNTSTTPKTTEI